MHRETLVEIGAIACPKNILIAIQYFEIGPLGISQFSRVRIQNTEELSVAGAEIFGRADRLVTVAS